MLVTKRNGGKCQHKFSRAVWIGGSFLHGPKSSHTIQNRFTCQSENVVYCITCRRCTSMYMGETGRHLRERFSIHLRSIGNRSPGLPVAEHFNSATHTIHEIRACRVKECSGSNTSRKWREMHLIFELGTLKPGGLNINFIFFSFYDHKLWLFFSCPRFTWAFFSQAFEWRKVHIPAH